MGNNNEADPILQFFTFEGMNPDRQAVVKPFCELASLMVAMLPRNPERTVMLRHLLDAKSAAERASMFKG